MINPVENEPEKQFQYRRMPALPRQIHSINPEKDIRVRILGRVIDKYSGTLVIDDGYGKAEIVAEEFVDKHGTGDLVRVFCRVMPLENGFELRAELVQNMNDLDFDLYSKVNS